MHKTWSDEAWEDYVYWQTQDRKTLKKINSLLADIERNGEESGIGKPEALKYEWSGWFSRKIDEKNRLVYRIVDEVIQIAVCRTHYER
ncbi:MAG: Txe/YoeB family addiction module toxin [Cloacibacillus sp.]